jgi:hypothetical protein
MLCHAVAPCKQMMDLGSVHERSTAIFTITLAQFAPAAVHGEEDCVMVRGAVACIPALSASVVCLPDSSEQGSRAAALHLQP